MSPSHLDFCHEGELALNTPEHKTLVGVTYLVRSCWPLLLAFAVIQYNNISSGSCQRHKRTTTGLLPLQLNVWFSTAASIVLINHIVSAHPGFQMSTDPYRHASSRSWCDAVMIIVIAVQREIYRGSSRGTSSRRLRPIIVHVNCLKAFHCGR